MYIRRFNVIMDLCVWQNEIAASGLTANLSKKEVIWMSNSRWWTSVSSLTIKIKFYYIKLKLVQTYGI